ncbi:hypothetical protein Kpol_543p6 [Vanderwaltozyma polyspora DSM 70294]|uniref:Rho-GAP domain-containing protein n=1 Tax=Vanderwaltozyma polyspora (strain ATCC 22028 / DSM 70294 / BCRC 21397 / CBS 2163 / NBRC 10782 / NRRL Y-8283 / UCD 57-17) TaxID=436907 RepID=A7THL1_VANPO|nr:uncharacterized protein Kpol_543p6 [Vanderwaltozyma polyspora DSM 70294]EDO18177.1 hypothetical protein Kpol_543p6 [Vanderwaltozyma polyspora DSM 70294]
MPTFWKNFPGNPKSTATDPLPSSKHRTIMTSNTKSNNTNSNVSNNSNSEQQNVKQTNLKRPGLPSKSHSYSNPPFKSKMASGRSSTDDYRDFRNKFLSNNYDFTGRVFGVSLKQSLSTASTDVMVHSESIGFGKIPIVVAKCGAYLKANALETPGIFRITGSTKRVKELQHIFSTSPDYGMKFNEWDAFAVHDYASLLRRFLNNLEEPLIPLSMYDKFRDPLKSRPRILKHLTKKAMEHPTAGIENKVINQSETTKVFNRNNTHSNEDKEDSGGIEKEQPQLNQEINDEDHVIDTTDLIKAEESRRRAKHGKKKLTNDIRSALKEYEQLFIDLNDDSRHLTLYLLDMLTLFDRRSDINLMTGHNLSAIFQPSMLSHPNHDMDPKEYELSRLVLEFLIEYSYKLVPFMLNVARPNQTAKIENPNRRSLLSIPTDFPDDEDELSSKPMIVASSIDESVKVFPKKISDTTETASNSSLPINNRIENKGMTPDRYKNSIPVNEYRNMNVNLLTIPTHGRPHSKSIGSASVPQDVIPSNKRRSKFLSWIHKPNLMSDSGEFSVTEEDGELSFDDCDMSINSISPNSVTTPQSFHNHTKQRISSRNSSNYSINMRPFSMVISTVNKSNDELNHLSHSNSNIEGKPSTLGGVDPSPSSSPTSVLNSAPPKIKVVDENCDEQEYTTAKVPMVRQSSDNVMMNVAPTNKKPQMRAHSSLKVDNKDKRKSFTSSLKITPDVRRKSTSANASEREAKSKKRQSWFGRLINPS